jgi:predicted RNase H-like HicB family nuclease
MTLKIELDREEDGRWIALIRKLPGVMVYGATKREAVSRVQALALQAIAEDLEEAHTSARLLKVSFVAA